jgi:feruloyl esterase
VIYRGTVLLLLACIASLASHAAAAAESAVNPCAALRTLQIPDTQLTEAEDVAGDAPVRVGPPFAQHEIRLPGAHCLVRGEVGRHTGADGATYAARFELRLPRDWNERFLFQGGGGLDGVLNVAVGEQGPPGSDRATALAQRYAVVATDGGHQQKGPFEDGSFGRDPRALADYQYRSTQVVTDAARVIVRAYYGHAARYSYFQGCSNGGREGMIAAQRYPEYFDGVIAGSPAFNLTKAMVAEAWNTVTFAAIAPAGANGRPDLPQALTDADLKVLAAAMLEHCDARDGLKDGLVDAVCKFDPAVTACSAARQSSCLAPEKVAAVRRAFAGPVNSSGQSLYSDWPYDPGLAAPGWRMWILGNAQLPAINVLIFPAAMNGVALAGEPPPIDLFRFNFDTDPQRLGKTSAALDATATQYTGFQRRRGKILFYAGMSDPVFSANDLMRYFGTVVAASGGPQKTAQFARLFLVPGMTHCGGGPALDDFDALTALTDWVEKSTPPDRIVARGSAFPGRTRPLCPFPQRARYTGKGSAEEAANFTCRTDAP